MKRVVTIIVFLILWGGWFFIFPDYLRWLESISFFSTLPDFTMLHFHLPEEFFSYCGAFLLQFYAYPAVGAAIQTAFPFLCVLCLQSMIRRIFKDSDNLSHLAFIALPVLVYLLADDASLVRSCITLTCFAAAALAVFLLTLVIKPRISVPEILKGRWMVTVSLAAACLSVYFIYDGPVDKDYEEACHLEYLGCQGNWEEILEIVTPKDAARNELKRKYALLALAETGKLTESALRYGLSGSEDFVFTEPKTLLTFNFNMLFYRSLGMANPIVQLAYQQETLSHTGLTFSAVRMLADTYLKLKDYNLAKRYIDILSHSTCHRRWVNERLPELEAIKSAEPEYYASGERFSLQTFAGDMWAMLTRYPDNSVYADYYLCGVLAEKDGNRFYKAFNVIAPELYPDGKGIPRLYQEALCPIVGQVVSEGYHIDDDVWNSFLGFNDCLRKGRQSEAKRKYAGTYWNYVLF